MADSRRYGLTPQLDIGQILLDAQNRWLRPTEVCEILRNYRKFCLTPDPPYKPTGGSLFLFDRKALRYFRKDGHNWRKKKDGKTVREAHERLKAGSVDVLHCYYAHGEDNENFQRRSYWMLEGQYEHIVLVHYREVKEGNRAGILRSINSERALQTANQKGQTASVHSTQENSNALLTQTAYASSTSTADCNGPTHSSEYEEGESGDDVGASPAAEDESSLGDKGSLLHPLNRVGELVTDSRSHPPLSHSKTFTNLLVENQTSYGHLNVNQAGSGQCRFSDLHLSDHGSSLNRDGESQQNVHFQSDHLSRYGNGVYSDRQIQSSTMNLGLSGWNELLRQSKNAETIGNGRNHRHDINSSTWTGVLQHCTTGLTNTAYEPKITGMQTVVSEDIRSRQLGNRMETLIRDELSGGQATFPDAHLQALARADVQKTPLQMGSGSQKLAPNPPCSRMHEQMADWGHGPSDVFQENKCLLRDLQNPHAPADEQIQIQMPGNGSYQFWGAECTQSVKLEGGNGLNSGTLPLDCQASKELLGGSSSHLEGQEGLKKLDSFGRWMSREIGGDGEDSLVASDSGTYWNALDNQNGVEEVSSLSIQMQLDVDLMGPSLSQEQLFSIIDFSPDWAYSEVDTKVLITGTFLGSLKHLHKYKWCCMFGEIEVSAELLGASVLRCQAPPHTPGRVPFYVTRSNRLACSEVREFEYRASPSGDINGGLNMDKEIVDKMLLQIRFAKALSLKLDIKQRYCCVNECEICSLRNKICYLTEDSSDEWVQTERCIKDSSLFLEKAREQLLQKLLKEKLHDWLLYKVHEEGKGPNILDEQGQGILHIGAALGYDWVLSPIIAAGVSINFRDLHGWTALHWAAFYGREETVVALVTLGAAPGALTDPTPKFPAGRTPADLASSRGQKGIAAYLAESYLTSHLSTMTLKENIMDSVSATLAGEKAVESVAEQSIVPLDGGSDDQLSLKDSLAAVRNSAQAAARIQAAFRVHSFRRKQLIEYGDDKCGMSDEQALSFVSVQKTQKLGHYNEALHSAAIRIQRKFRGWKGRKEFLLIRNRIVKIQAHVRGHQVRKHYKKVVWSVGIVEKAILRWRRKRVGLRGFRAEALMGDSDAQGGGQHDDYDFLRAGRKQTVAGLEKALARVQSMVRYPEARDQYRRLVTNFQKTKVDIEGIADGESQKLKDSKIDEQDVLLPMTD